MSPEISLLDRASLLLRIYSCFQSLIESGGSSKALELSLGGKLLYAGELDDEGRSIVLAGNIAGCATLSATHDIAAQKQAIRDGVVDFLVTSLDEALRILKNEVRKQGTVAVCIAQASDEVEREMLERGVQPDLTRESAAADAMRMQWAESAEDTEPMSAPATIVWQVQQTPAKWLPGLDAIALDCINSADAWNRRWLRLLPRYLGRLAPDVRAVCADREFAASFVERLRAHYDRGNIEAQATVLVRSRHSADEYNFAPHGLARANQP